QDAVVVDGDVALGGIGIDADAVQQDAAGLDRAAVVDVDVAGVAGGIDATRIPVSDRRDRAAVVHRGEVVAAHRNARGGVEAGGLDGAAVGDVHVHGRAEDAIGVAVEGDRSDRAAVVHVDVAVVGPGEDAGRRVGVAVGVDVAAVADRGAAPRGTAEAAHGLAVDAGVARRRVLDVHVAHPGRGQHAPAAGRALRIDRADRAAVDHVHVARAGIGADAVGAPRVDADVAAVGDGDAVHATGFDAGADVLGHHVDRTGAVDECAAVLRGGDDAAG